MIRTALIGMGKIARDQHVPALHASDRFDLVAAVDPHGTADGIPLFADFDSLLDSGIAVDAVAICTPPALRHGIAIRAIDAGLAVLLEKPPAATLGAVTDLTRHAEAAGVTLFAAWHSRFAPGVAAARAWLAERRPTGGRIAWCEDIRRWHPGQEWILAPGGFGVFDPGINALSILTAILPGRVTLTQSRLGLPEGRAAPLKADLVLQSGGATIDATFDFLQSGPQTWSITVETAQGTLMLVDGGHRLLLDGEGTACPDEGEYPALYRHFAELIAVGASEVDASPLSLVADALLLAHPNPLPSFSF